MKAQRLKSQMTNSKSQISSKLQCQMTKYVFSRFGWLEFIWNLGFGYWNLKEDGALQAEKLPAVL